MTDTTMGQRIAECRKKQNLSQEALGDKLGISRQAISKWESDGAVPDVDKLIGLSKLFGVTVGWLLGVEEDPKDPADEEFTEAQLKTVEEIVKRYQSQSMPEEKNTAPLWLKLVAIAAVVIVALAALSSLRQQVDQNTSYISGLNGSYSTIQNQLSILASRLDELAAGEKLLSDFTVEAAAWDDGKGATLSFTMTPKSWNENDTAYVAVRHADTEVERFECRWDGTVCSAEVSLSARDGYEYYYTVTHADGTQEQELMSGTGYENVAYCLSWIWFFEFPETTIGGGWLIINNYTLDVSAPEITPTHTVALESIEWVITVNGKEYHREEIHTILDQNLTTSGIQTVVAGMHKFQIPETVDGDVVLLSAEICLSDGTHTVLDALQFEQRGSDWVQADFPPAAPATTVG